MRPNPRTGPEEQRIAGGRLRMPTSATSYDEVPYLAHAFFYTHPESLAMIALLYGLEPPPIEHCRVLELGCGIAGNLIPMALGLPGSSFVGIDLSAKQIESGQQIVAELGLKNIQLR